MVLLLIFPSERTFTFCDYCQVNTSVSLSSMSCKTDVKRLHKMLISVGLLLLLLQLLACAGNFIEIFIFLFPSRINIYPKNLKAQLKQLPTSGSIT